MASASTLSVVPAGTSTSPRTVTSKSSGSRSAGLASRSAIWTRGFASRLATTSSAFVLTFGAFGAFAFAPPPATTASLARITTSPPAPPESPAPPGAWSDWAWADAPSMNTNARNPTTLRMRTPCCGTRKL